MKDPKIDDKIPIDIYIVVGIVMCFIVINISYKLSEISNKRVEKTEDALKEGQNVRVKVISMENEDKFNLSMKALKQ